MEETERKRIGFGNGGNIFMRPDNCTVEVDLGNEITYRVIDGQKFFATSVGTAVLGPGISSKIIIPVKRQK